MNFRTFLRGRSEIRGRRMANVDNKENSVVAVYRQHADAENAVNPLTKSDFNVKKLAIAIK
jgi:hypothetical protein